MYSRFKTLSKFIHKWMTARNRENKENELVRNFQK